MRYSELSQIDSEHYDKRSGKIRIESTKQKCKNPNRWIPLTPAALVSVERWIREVLTNGYAVIQRTHREDMQTDGI